MADEQTATAALEAYAALEAEKHKPEPGGCTCGFCAWSVAHVVIMSIRDGWPLAERDQILGNSPVVQQLVALDRAGELAYTEVPGDRELVERATDRRPPWARKAHRWFAWLESPFTAPLPWRSEP